MFSNLFLEIQTYITYFLLSFSPKISYPKIKWKIYFENIILNLNNKASAIRVWIFS